MVTQLRYARRTKRPVHLAFVVAAVALAIGFVILQLIRIREPLALDQGLFACFGEEVPRGAVPYRDIFDSKPPLFLYTWVLAWAPGQSATSVWCFEAVWLAATMGLAFAVTARLVDRWAGLGAAAFVLAGMWSPGFGGYWSRFQAEELLALPALGAAWLALSAIERPRLACWVGVLVGVVGLYKLPGMAIGGAFVALWVVKLPRPEVLRRLAWTAAGLVAPWLVTLIWFAAHGALGAFWEAVFVYQRHFVELVAPPWSDLPGELARTLGRELSPVLVAATAGLVALWRTDRGHFAMVATWIGLTLLAILLQRQLAGYHYLLVVPGLAIAGGCGLRAAATRTGLIVIAVVAILAAMRVPAWRTAYGPGARHVLGGASRAKYLRSFEGGLLSPAVEENAARYLRAHTTADDRILVWGLSPGIYALAHRQPATRFPFHKLLLTDAPLSRAIPGLAERRAAFMRQLVAAPPAYILIGTNDRNPFEPLDSVRGMIEFTEFERFVAGGYREETRVGRFVLLARSP